MNRRALLSLCLFGFVSLGFGCGSNAPPPADGSNLPDEVRAEQEKMEAIEKQHAANREAASKKTH